MVWVCEENEIDDRQVSVSVTSPYWMAPRRGQDVIPTSQIVMQRNISLVTEWDLDRNTDSDGDGIETTMLMQPGRQ